MTRYGAYGGHHIGTARMGHDPHLSVVDADCRIHGVSNLSIASAAVFPTSSQANPTLTVVALALRLADRLRAEIIGRV
jgi:choline dehydrogenase-like flavoprotein